MLRPAREQWHGLTNFIFDFLNQHYPLGDKKMSNKFVSWLQHVGQAFNIVLHIAATTGEAAVAVFAPELGPIFNATVAAVVLAERKYAALGKQAGTGQQKLADVLMIAEPVIAQALADAGKPSDTAAVTNYVNGVVAVLNAAPSPVVA
jgi:hypothetical protein